jgi:Domain of unknown function (DUF4410)
MRRPGMGKFAALATVFIVLGAFPFVVPKQPVQAAQSSPSDAQKVPVYISDFELFAAAATDPNKKNAAESAKRPENPIYSDADPAAVQAQRLMDAFAITLVEMFQKGGYSASRLNGSVPSTGVLLRGVFAEPDDLNRIRRAILGAGSTAPTFMLYVGIFNLAHEDQPLYRLAPAQSPDSRFGPVISLNAYIPLVKYEVGKDPSVDDMRRICDQIVGGLTKLLTQNPSAIPK